MPFPCYLKIGTLFQKSGKLRRRVRKYNAWVGSSGRRNMVYENLPEVDLPSHGLEIRGRTDGKEFYPKFDLFSITFWKCSLALFGLWKIINCILRCKAQEA